MQCETAHDSCRVCMQDPWLRSSGMQVLRAQRRDGSTPATGSTGQPSQTQSARAFPSRHAPHTPHASQCWAPGAPEPKQGNQGACPTPQRRPLVAAACPHRPHDTHVHRHPHSARGENRGRAPRGQRPHTRTRAGPRHAYPCCRASALGRAPARPCTARRRPARSRGRVRLKGPPRARAVGRAGCGPLAAVQRAGALTQTRPAQRPSTSRGGRAGRAQSICRGPAAGTPARARRWPAPPPASRGPGLASARGPAAAS